MSNRVANKKQFELKDHLGNVRAVISDCKNPETANIYTAKNTAEIQNINNYYSFGMPMHRRNYTSSLGSYRFGFNGQEKDDELKGEGNSLDFGARIYDSRLGRWLSTDSKEAKFPMMSPYMSMGNNPVLFVDVDGNVFVTYISVREKNETTGEIKRVNYKVVFNGTNTTMQEVNKGKTTGVVKDYQSGTSQFVDDMVTSYNYIVDNNADVDGAMKKMAEIPAEINVQESKGGGLYQDGVIQYDFAQGVKIDSKDGTVDGIQSPALGFWAEVYHSYIDKVDSKKKDDFKSDNVQHDDEEEYVHVEKEGQVIDSLKKSDAKNNETKRTTYGDGWKNVKTKGVTSTEKK